jgi:hypothetical protein
MSNKTTSVNNTNQVTQADLNAHSEQAMIELVYVQTANDILGQAMGNLDSALTTTRSVLNILTALQNLKNDLNVTSKSAFGFNYFTGLFDGKGIFVNNGQSITRTTLLATGSTRVTANFNTGTGSRSTTVLVTVLGKVFTGTQNTAGAPNNVLGATNFQATYNAAASTYFGKPITPNFNFSGAGASGFVSFRTTLSALKANLAREISVLTQQTPSGSRTDPDGLLASVQKVYNELPSNMNYATIAKWVLDNYNNTNSTGAGSAGALQNDITFAITAAESLNDTQKEKVRSYLFIFQEYYQSATAVLTSLQQIIQDMATKISQ